MAISERQLEISNKSYINKDFEAVYNELLTYAQKLSTRFSPVDSVESDPFIILLKLAAFVSDKTNYSVDKNILERFLLSCTQRQSMQELTSMLGYNMHYYKAAIADVVFKYQFSDSDTSDITIPAGSTLLTEDNIQFTTRTTTTISRDTGVSNTIEAIQGKLKTLEILNSDVIQLENLTASNYLYFPEYMVAENGINITHYNSSTSGSWNKVDNLNSQVYGSYIYKVGFDSTQNLPYIEFPSWITDIIGNGLQITYIVTDGETGNIAARALTSVSRIEASDGIPDEDIIVVNASAGAGGSDPETLDASYQGFKKIIGTFDTLVTCRDYANKIYNLTSATTKLPFVSNAQVSDRRTDINFGTNVLTYGNDGDLSQTIVSKDVFNYALTATTNLEFKTGEYGTAAPSSAPIDPSHPYYFKTNDKKIYRYITSWADVSDEYKRNNQTLIYYNTSDVTATVLRYYGAEWNPLVYLDIAYCYIKGLNKVLSKTVTAATWTAFTETNRIFYIQREQKYLKSVTISSGLEWIELSAKEVADIIAANDIYVYGLRNIVNKTLSDVSSADGYNNSYNMISEDTFNMIKLNSELVDCKTLCHKLNNSTNSVVNSKAGKIQYIKDYYTLTAIVNTTSKVSAFDQSTILTNIWNAIIAKYNPRELDFGQQIAFDELLSVMEESDSRIKSISILDPDHDFYIVTKDGEVPLKPFDNYPSSEFRFIIAKNILSGRVSLFEYDTDFDYSFSYKSMTKHEDIKKITTQCNLAAFPATTTTSYTLKTNEVIQFLAPKLNTGVTYAYGIDYYLKLNSSDTSIPANTYYVLKNGDELVMTYMANEERFITPYVAGDVIYTKSELFTIQHFINRGESPAATNVSNLTYPTKYKDYNFYKLGTNDEVSECKFLTDDWTSSKYCYWLTNSENNKIKWESRDGRYEYILQDNEYFFVTDLSFTELYSYGSGTKLTCDSSTASGVWTHDNTIPIDTITAEGLTSLRNYFILKPFTTTANLTATINEIITLLGGNTITVQNNSSAAFVIDNNSFGNPINDNLIIISYKIDDETTQISSRSSFALANRWRCRAVLDINAGPSTAQLLEGNEKMIFYKGDDETAATIEAGLSVKFNYDLQKNGGEKINVDLSELIELGLDIDKLSALVFELDSNTASALQYKRPGVYSINFRQNSSSETATSYDLHISPLANETNYFMVYAFAGDFPAGIDLTLTAKDSNNATCKALQLINTDTPGEEITSSVVLNAETLQNRELFIFRVNNPACRKIVATAKYVENTENSAASIEALRLTNIDISELKYVKGYNSMLNLNSNFDLLTYMQETFPEQMSKFYVLGSVDSDKQIDLTSNYGIESAKAFYDVNNIANSWVMGKIDIENSKIKFSTNSQK